MTQLSLSDRTTAAVLGAIFGAAIGLAVAWLAMFSSTLGILGIGPFPISFAKSAAAGAAFFAIAGALFGASAGTLVGLVLNGIFRFERLYDQRSPLWIEVLLLAAGVAVIVWANGAFT
jgi:hypothetical protein